MNIVFMGTPDFAVPTLEMLISEGHTITAVVTQPDRPKGRGKKEMMPPVKEVALQHNIPVFQPEKIRTDEAFYETLKGLNPDLIIVVAFGQILPEKILQIPRLGCVNVHGSLLPAYRGAAPIQWSVINGEPVTGVTIMYMDKGMDTGDMLLKREMPLAVEETYESLHNKMCVVGAAALKEAMPLIISGGTTREKQDESKATYAPMIHKELACLDFTKSAAAIDSLIRGLIPWPVAYTYYEEAPMKIWKAKPLAEKVQREPGTILKVTKEGMFVQTGDGILLVEEIQMPNKKRMLVAEYTKGNSIEPGKVLRNLK